ncbi:iron-sulfur cluster biosynthesis transcriptional regulator SufR [filamentous cyanobacterium LEGE 11480]|uniref:Iron-sulfur cluster biosynthesis transcriptional regulator SufR n=1 Tax=Romeriopsis navalis LEGE 11480 TaxID=2777977 RepID=A0A928VNY0_9CYAN|nr:iron-sulfur cluster biosynthesis transcriptional regulator SufR [Romeriopsis navalis]MBE9032001.1 iron-sulfur cluster biosynthesis transcriptional regulator SufR [Romeriopsis navalis LEGE 11480]
MTTSQQPNTKQDILTALLKQGQLTAHDLAERLEMTPQGIRRHLKDLETEGLIVHETVAAKMGRPNHVYALSADGRKQFPDRYDSFSIDLLDTLAKTVGKEQMASILQQQWQRKATEYRSQVGSGDLYKRVQKLVEMRQSEGYMAECHLVEPENPDAGFVLTEYNCAISQIAESYPSVCGNELEMFSTALPDCKVERTHWLVGGEHRCGYLITSRL